MIRQDLSPGHDQDRQSGRVVGGLCCVLIIRQVSHHLSLLNLSNSMLASQYVRVTEFERIWQPGEVRWRRGEERRRSYRGLLVSQYHGLTAPHPGLTSTVLRGSEEDVTSYQLPATSYQLPGSVLQAAHNLPNKARRGR